MDPISIGLQAVGLGMQLFGSGASIFGSSKSNEINQRIAEDERRANEERRKAMELNSRRQQLQNVRNVQLQRSMALNSATAQGAQFGTGLAGGQAQITQAGNFNDLGIRQNTEIGRNLFDINDDISRNKAELSATQSKMALYQGIAGLGSSFMKIGPTAGNLAKGFNFGPDTYSGGGGLSAFDQQNRYLFPGYGTGM